MAEANTPGSLSPNTAVLATPQVATPVEQGQDQAAGNQTPASQPAGAQATEQPKPDDFGGFTNKDELVKAYNELRSWNTRLSQEVKQVQGRLSQSEQQPQQVTPQDLLNQFVQAPQEILEGVRNQAVQDAMRQVNATLTVSRVIEEAKALNPDVVTPENEEFLSALARKAPVPDGLDPIAAAKVRMDYAVKGFREFVSKIKASGVKEGTANAAMKAQAGFETGGVTVNSQPGLNKDAVLKLLRDNPDEYKRLWKEKPNEMIAAFSS